MSTPIKTLVLNSIKSCVVPLIGDANRVFLDPSRGLREETTEPYANIFTDAESSKKLDLWSEKSFQIEVHTWVKADTDDKAREAAILLSAQIQQVLLMRDSASRQFTTYFEEAGGNCHDVLFYREGLCVAVSRYDVKYRHTYGNPFQLNP